MPLLSPELFALHRELGIPKTYAESRGLPFQPEVDVSQLVTIASRGGRQIQLVASAAAAWTWMAEAARHERVVLLPISGFRSFSRQAEIIRRKLDEGKALKTVLGINAAPGYSEHHTGRAVDISTPLHPHLEESFALTNAFKWLTLNAPSFGFTMTYPRDNAFGIIFEPWHWCWSK